MSFLLRIIACALLISALTVSMPAYAQEDNKEYLVKAAFIVNFFKFVQWPEGNAITKGGTANVCMVGSNPFKSSAGVFKEAAKVNQIQLNILEESQWKSGGTHCHIQFYSKGAGSSPTGQAGVLTVSDSDGFAEGGGMIELAMKDNKIRLVVNNKVAKQQNLRIGGEVLEISQRVIN